ncbi:PadR family transcriptional regulator [Candidatus Woesearchaeota archaeon]|nr:PadR family transcriptional regulator [Candidatus Woesearchaeota archaeon]
MQINSLVKFYSLLLIGEEPKHGYELMKELQAKLDRGISPSQVYPFLAQLAKKGLISVESTGVRDRKTYRLTKTGKRFVTEFLGSLEDLISASVKSSLTACAHCGCKVFGKAKSRLVGGKQLSFCCTACAKSFKHKV